MIERPLTRRDAVLRGALAAGGVVAATALRPGIARAQSASDEDLRDFLVEAIALEQITVLAYSTAADAGGVDAGLKRTFDAFRDQEQAHATALRNAIDPLGFDPPDAPDSAADTGVFDDVEGIETETASRLSDLLAELEGLRRPDELLEYLSKLEREQLEFYLAQAPGLDSVDLSTTGAEIAGCQAEHLIVLGERLRQAPAEALAATDEVIRSASAAASS